MEKLFLRALFISKKLDIIDQQGVNGAVVALKFFNGVVLQSFYHVLHKALGVHVNHFCVGFTRHNPVTNRV